MATKNATKEQEDIILEDIKIDATPGKGDIDDENLQIDRSMLPPLYNYALDYFEYLHGGQDLDIEEIEEEEKKEQQQQQTEMEEEEEEVELPQNFHQDSDDEEEMRNLVRNFWVKADFLVKERCQKSIPRNKEVNCQELFYSIVCTLLITLLFFLFYLTVTFNSMTVTKETLDLNYQFR